ncbi:MAG: DUF6484 domain-containing protein [Agarilytica sp.]
MNKIYEPEVSQEVLTASTPEVAANNELILGMVASVDAASQPKVEYFLQGKKYAVNAITTQALSADQVGRQVALMFVNGNGQQPIVLGLIRNALDDAIDNFEKNNEVEVSEQKVSETSEPNVCKVDGEKLVLEGKEEVVLKCGSSSISLNKNGKIVLRGKYLVSRSSGVNRIMGGSVQVN